jgi:energy-coupling factor transporter ATP-binding protein EcfA2
MPKDLILNSLEIQRFRCFRELRIGHLGRVNLIVGKNNVGKSTILEALRLYAKPASVDELMDILASRNEIAEAEVEAWYRNLTFSPPVDSLFFGRRSTPGEEGAIVIGSLDSREQRLSISLESQYHSTIDVEGSQRGRKSFENVQHAELYYRQLLVTFRIGSLIQVFFRAREPAFYRVFELPVTECDTRKKSENLATTLLRTIPFYAVGPNGLSSDGVGELWDNVALSPLEQDVISALQIISPGVDRVALRASRDKVRGNSHDRDMVIRIPFVKVDGFDEPIPLRALGDGVNRLFGIVLALVHAKDGLLLVDEIENGIHYSVQAALWRLVFEMATRLNVQVFATTHSYDCIKAFEEAARESEEEGVLVRLARKGDRTLVGEFDERELEIAVEGEIEVR